MHYCSFSTSALPPFGADSAVRPLWRWVGTGSTALVIVAALGLLALPTAGQAQAEDEEDDIAGIDQIVVTITKRAERLGEVSAAISAFDQEQIQDANIQELSDLVALLPNVQIKGGGNGFVTIRGIAQSFTSQSPVAMHTNGLFAYDGLYGQLYDVRSVEVQRGPVGTVYGRNATAGAINVNWNEPHDSWEVFADTTVGNYDTYQFRGGLNVPLLGEGNQKLMGRFVLQRLVHDGYLDNLEDTRSNSPRRGDEFTARASLRSVLSEDLEITVRGFWHQSKNGNSVGPLLDDEFPVGLLSFFQLTQTPGNPSGELPFDIYGGLQQFIQANIDNTTFLSILGVIQNPGNQAAGIQDVLLNGFAGFGVPPLILDAGSFIPAQTPSSNRRKIRSTAFDSAGSPVAKRYGLDGTLTWDVHDLPLFGDVEIRLLGGWYRTRGRAVPDGDGSEIVIVDTSQYTSVEHYTADLQFVSKSDGPFSWIAGVFFFDRVSFLDQQSFLPFGLFVSIVDQHDTGWGPYVSGSWRPFENMTNSLADLEIFGGVRWNKDTVERDIVQPDTLLRPGSANSGNAKFRQRTGELGTKWFWSEDQMVYLKWSRGYKAGGFNDAGPAFAPEIVKAWEAGSKNSFLDGRLQVNLTAFYYGYTDLQVPQILSLQVLTLNAAEATLWGAEIEIFARPTPEWTIAVTVGHLDATFDEFCADDSHVAQGFDDPGCPRASGSTALTSFNGERDLSGHRLEDAPKWTASLYTTYEWSLGEWGTLTGVLEFSWTDDQFRRPFNLPIDKIDSRTKTDVRFVWRSESEQYTIEIFGEHLEDETVYGFPVVLPESFGGAMAGFGLFTPRTFGVRFSYHWGGRG